MGGSTKAGGEVVEEEGTDGGGVADVACLAGATGVDHGDRTAGGAIGELVVGAGGELALVESRGGGSEGECCRKGSEEGSLHGDGRSD